MPSSSGGSLVRDTALGLGPVLLLWGAYLALQLSNEGRARCSPVYFAILAVQARTTATSPCHASANQRQRVSLGACVGAKSGVCVPAVSEGRQAEPCSAASSVKAHTRYALLPSCGRNRTCLARGEMQHCARRQVAVGVAALALAMWLANRMYRAALAREHPEYGKPGGARAVGAEAGSGHAEEASAAARTSDFQEPDFTVRGLLHTSAFALLAGVLAGALGLTAPRRAC